jgi:hypothetical protein
MRKLFWCGCAALVAVAVCLFVSARCVERNPHSLTARCVHVAWRVATDWNPVVQAGRFMGAQSVTWLRQGQKAPSSCQAPVPPCPPADPGEGHATPPVIEVIDLSSFPQPRNPNDPTTTMLPAVARHSDGLEEVEVVPPGAIEDSEPVPPPMPPCDDDEPMMVDGELLPVPHGMDETDAEELPMPQATDEEADMVPASMPPSGQEDAAKQGSCPRCPGMNQCPRE